MTADLQIIFQTAGMDVFYFAAKCAAAVLVLVAIGYFCGNPKPKSQKSSQPVRRKVRGAGALDFDLVPPASERDSLPFFSAIAQSPEDRAVATRFSPATQSAVVADYSVFGANVIDIRSRIASNRTSLERKHGAPAEVLRFVAATKTRR